jgi:hypothetical protein
MCLLGCEDGLVRVEGPGSIQGSGFRDRVQGLVSRVLDLGFKYLRLLGCKDGGVEGAKEVLELRERKMLSVDRDRLPLHAVAELDQQAPWFRV